MSQLLCHASPSNLADLVVPETDRVFTAVLFIDIVNSTRRVAAFGDRHWRGVLADFQAAVREQLQYFHGIEVDAVGDGFLAAFADPACAIYCAAAIQSAIRSIGLEIRAGIHAGECELHNGKPVGIVVHAGARLRLLAAPDEILVSQRVKELAAKSNIAFEHRGQQNLRGLSEPWALFAAKP
jgi:class 3 adenylate cyclase